ncbi:TlpA family protein disulfide reductase [Shewanella sp. 202IG2-18]|uniref:TlpA family protein disulfide reductase n=1 Tax=Parashewanella hymeniacidonis TaxID=2807618 RepID=UPI00195F36B0|nr:TlpA disulfide reductase family protein [Parashewanella hymeniacidonis]MBM7071847.1 TlpA family protein disulfide reductase [Parashewanella hymeniacidonis]
MLKVILSLCLLLTPMLATAQQSLSVGDKAPNFTIKRLNGTQFHLADYQGKKPVYLIFWNTWCGYCIQKVPTINELARTYGQALEILAVNTSWSDDKELIRAFQQQHQTDYPMAFDDNATITDLFDVWGSPTEFIIDINGRIQHRDKIPQVSAKSLDAWTKPCLPEVC